MNYEFKVLGIKDVNFKDDSGKHVQGLQLWASGDSGDESWLDNVEIAKIWIPVDHPLEAVVMQLQIGDRILVSFDRRGKPMAIETVA